MAQKKTPLKKSTKMASVKPLKNSALGTVKSLKVHTLKSFGR